MNVSQAQRARSPTPLADLTEADVLPAFAERFVYEDVREAFEALEAEALMVLFEMCDFVFGVAQPASISADLREVRRGAGAGPYWVVRTFPTLGGSKIATLEPLNGDLPRILDFAIPSSSRRQMNTLAAMGGAHLA